MSTSRKPASSATIAVNQEYKDNLPFDDTRSFEDAKRGLIEALPQDCVITNDAGGTAWNYGEVAFAKEGEPTPDTVNPSLWRQAQVMHEAGLFEVVKDGIYQVRGTDLTNITFIEGPEGVVVMDPLTSVETAKFSLDLYRKHRGDKPIVAVVHTHSHIDHYGGVRGVVDEADVKAGKVKIVAPEHYMADIVDEMLMGGTAMSRRSSYQYGEIVGNGPDGIVTSGLGLAVADGTVSLLEPTDIISNDNLEMTLAGLKFQFKMAPDTEAPAEMFFYVPEYKALCPAECACHTQHNVYTLRGAKVRDAAAWSRYLKEVRREFSDAEVYFGPHQWPNWGNDVVMDRLHGQSQMYKYLHDQTMRLANEGYTMVEVAEMVQLPDVLAKQWDHRGYYGTTNHNVKAIWNFYLGWYDGNPSHLHPLPPADSAPHYVEYMGGADAIMEKAKKDYEAGNYRWLAEVLSHLVFAQPENQDAKNLLADVLEQLGYQSEAGTWRGWYLTGAHELRHGVKRQSITTSTSPDTVRATPTGSFFDYMAIQVNSEKAAGKKLAINFDFTDSDEKYALILENSVLDYEADYVAEDADLSVTLTREALNKVIENAESLDQLLADGEVKVEGNSDAIAELGSVMDKFDLFWPIVTP